jgi:hypothetical protein
MVITPTLRGLFGISIDAPSKTITVNPHLPASWDHAALRNLHIGDAIVNVNFVRSKGAIIVSLDTSESGIRLNTGESGVKSTSGRQLTIPDHAVQIAPVLQSPQPGGRTRSPRVLDEHYSDRKLTLTLEGPADTDAHFPLVLFSAPGLKLHAANADIASEPPSLSVHFPPSPSGPARTGELAWTTISVTLTW